MNDSASPEHMENGKRGPVGLMVVRRNGVPIMGESLLRGLVISVGVGLFTGDVAHFALPGTVAYLAVFRITGTVAFLGYGLANVTDSIWKGVSWTPTAKFLFDGLLHALVTAGTFAWLWPHLG